MTGLFKKSSLLFEAVKYQNAIYIGKFCHQVKVMGCLLAREIKKLKSAVLVNDSVCLVLRSARGRRGLHSTKYNI